MTYKEKVTFDGKIWYQLEWEDVDFQSFHIKEINDTQSIEELKEVMQKLFPESNLKIDYIGERHKTSKISKKKKNNG